jgi:hypothetical protein
MKHCRPHANAFITLRGNNLVGAQFYWAIAADPQSKMSAHLSTTISD